MNNIIFKTALIKGEAGNNIQSIEKTATSGAVDTYTITLTDGSTTTFNVTNGSNIASITLTGSSGLVDTYTVTLTDGSTTTFDVRNGQDYTVPTNGMIYYDDDNALPEGYEVAGNFTDEILAGEASGNVASFIGLDNTIVKELVATIEPVQAGSGTPSPTNVRAISGHTSCTVTNCGKNMFSYNLEIRNGYWLNNQFNGDNNVVTLNNATGWQYIKIPVKAGDTITASGLINQGGVYSAFIGDNPNIILSTFSSANNNATRVVPSGAKYVCFVLFNMKTNAANYPNAQVEIGAQATTYEAYQENTATISFGAAGTVYGGVVDLTTGLLTIDRGYAILDGTEDYQVGETSNFRYFNCLSSIYLTNAWETNVLSNEFAKQGTYPYVQFDGSKQVRFCFSLNDTSVTTVAELQTLLQNTPAQIIYKLATPQTYQLTPTQLRTLEDTNNITSNTGAIEKIVYFKSSIIADIYERLLALE